MGNVLCAQNDGYHHRSGNPSLNRRNSDGLTLGTDFSMSQIGQRMPH